MHGFLNKVSLMHYLVSPNTHCNLFITLYHLTYNFSVDCIIENGSKNFVIVKSIFNKLKLPIETHPHPYSLAWKDSGSLIMIIYMCTLSFSLGPKFMDKITCDMNNMDYCGLLLSKSYCYDRKASQHIRILER